MALFHSGDKVGIVNVYNTVIMTGTIVKLRDDKWERDNSWPMGYYFYHVDFDKRWHEQSSFDTYIPQSSLKLLKTL